MLAKKYRNYNKKTGKKAATENATASDVAAVLLHREKGDLGEAFLNKLFW